MRRTSVVAADVRLERRRAVNAHGGADTTLAAALGQVVFKVSPFGLLADESVDDETAPCADEVGRSQVLDKRFRIFVQAVRTHRIGHR